MRAKTFPSSSSFGLMLAFVVGCSKPATSAAPAEDNAENSPSTASFQEAPVQAPPSAQAQQQPQPQPVPAIPRSGERTVQAHATEGVAVAPAAPAHRSKPTPTQADSVKPAVAAPAAAPVACGEEGQPPCPLQGWMERHLQAAVEAGDLARVAGGLARAAKLAPLPEWNSGDLGWARIAETGAAAANAGDLVTARQSCKGCHKAWRAKYKAGFRMRPIAE